MSFNIGQIQKALSPQPFALVASTKENGKPNFMALSWWCFASNHPATVIICLSRKGYSGECIKRTKEFALCFPTEAVRDAAFKCGTCSGRDTDKAEKFNIEMTDASAIGVKLVRDTKAALECRLVDFFDVSDHTIYVGEVVEAHCNPDVHSLYAFDGYAKLDTIQA